MFILLLMMKMMTATTTTTTLSAHPVRIYHSIQFIWYHFIDPIYRVISLLLLHHYASAVCVLSLVLLCCLSPNAFAKLYSLVLFCCVPLHDVYIVWNGGNNERNKIEFIFSNGFSPKKPTNERTNQPIKTKHTNLVLFVEHCHEKGALDSITLRRTAFGMAEVDKKIHEKNSQWILVSIFA